MRLFTSFYCQDNGNSVNDQMAKWLKCVNEPHRITQNLLNPSKLYCINGKGRISSHFSVIELRILTGYFFFNQLICKQIFAGLAEMRQVQKN